MNDHRHFITEFLYKNFPNKEFLLADGFELAFLGVKKRGKNIVLCYDREICLAILMCDGLSFEDAIEYFDFNVSSAYLGALTPLFI
jgi:hypothetical protein